MTPVLAFLAGHGRRQPVRPVPGRQSGVVLIVALIMLVIIGLTSAAVMRNALSADAVTNSNRSEALATEAAQIALKFCETAILATTPTVSIQPASTPTAGQVWTNLANWARNSPVSTELTVEDVRSSDAALSLSTDQLPQCMAEDAGVSGPSGTQAVIVTARGFSPDYTQDASGRPQSGSVVWLQSTLSISDN